MFGQDVTSCPCAFRRRWPNELYSVFLLCFSPIMIPTVCNLPRIQWSRRWISAGLTETFSKFQRGILLLEIPPAVLLLY